MTEEKGSVGCLGPPCVEDPDGDELLDALVMLRTLWDLADSGRWEPFCDVAAAYVRLPTPRPTREEIRQAGNRDLNRPRGWFDDPRDCPKLSEWVTDFAATQGAP